MILPVVTLGHPALRKKSSKVIRFNQKLRQIAADMIETMDCQQGIGLAAPQVDIDKRIFVTRVANDKKTSEKVDAQVFINPIIKEKSEKLVNSQEGCLSIPNFQFEIKRHSEIVVKYYDLDQNVLEEECSGLKAICIQHEIDHLNGILFIDHIEEKHREEAKLMLHQGNFSLDVINSEMHFAQKTTVR